MDDKSSEKNVLKVIRIDVLTASPKYNNLNENESDIHLPDIPILSFELENGSTFMMSSIPTHIAIEIARVLTGVKEVDSRLTIADLVSEVCVVKKVVIDAIVPYSNAYQATIEIQLEGSDGTLHYQMVPSHSVLVALLNNAPIYIAQELLK